MAPVVIDLTSSPEPEESPHKAAKSALQGFEPRTQKNEVPKPVQNRLSLKVARDTAAHLPPKQSVRSSATNGSRVPTPEAIPSLLDVANDLANERKRQDEIITENGYQRPAYSGNNAHFRLPLGHAQYARPSTIANNSRPEAVSGASATKPTHMPRNDGLRNVPAVKSTLPKATPAIKCPKEVISIDDDSDTSSSNSADPPTDAHPEANELDDLRPFKRQRIDDPSVPRPKSGDTNTTGLLAPVQRPTLVTQPSGSVQVVLSGQRSPAQRSLDQSKPSSINPKRCSTSRHSSHVEPDPASAPTANSDLHTEETVIPPAPRAANNHVNPTSASQAVAINTADKSSSSLLLSKDGHESSSGPSMPLTLESTHSSSQPDTQTVQVIAKPFRPRQKGVAHNHSTAMDSAASSQSSPPSRNRGKPYSQAEDDLLLKLRDIHKLGWSEILPHLPGRTIGSISGHYSELRARSKGQRQGSFLSAQQSQQKDGIPFSKEEDDLLIFLRDVKKLEFKAILPYFIDRTMGSITGHYGQLRPRQLKQTEAPKQARRTEQGATEPVAPTPGSEAKLVASTEQGAIKANRGLTYTTEEDALLAKLKGVDKLSWDEIAPYFPGRTYGSLQVRYSTKLKSKPAHENTAKAKESTPPVAGIRPVLSTGNAAATNHGTPYNADEDPLIVKLKEEDGLSFDQMVPLLNGRTAGSLATRYSSKLKNKTALKINALDSNDASALEEEDISSRLQRRRRHNGPSTVSGFIAWSDVQKSRRHVSQDEESAEEEEEHTSLPFCRDDLMESARQIPLQRILRHREIGSSCGRGAIPSTRSIPDRMKEHVFDSIGPRRCFQGTSGDVTCVAWAPDSSRFAAGSIAITDERSMQYNRPYNLLLGDTNESMLSELPEHHVQRPRSDDVANVNSLHSMRETQDQRLFMTVGNVQFSPDSRVLYSVGTDCIARAYTVAQNACHASCVHEFEHPAPVYLLSVSNNNILATASHQATQDSVRVYNQQHEFTSLSPSRSDSQTERPIYPSALRWGISPHHSNLLLAGFSIDSFDEERNLGGETCLWDAQHEARIEISAVTRNVFDVAWNPSPSSGSTAFAVASTPGSNKVNKGTRTVVQCFAPRQKRAAAVLEFESRAFDVNDVVYCPHDNNLIAAGATDGKVYVWDQRFASKGSAPLHVLAHDHTLNILDHDRDRELADTGVRFLSWGATSSRLYSGSSDGVVKLWNPYLSTSNAHVKDVATFTSAVMSGAFSSDFRDLLVGEDQGRINLLSVGHQDRSIRSMDRFELRTAHPPPRSKSNIADDGRLMAHELVKAGQIELKPMAALPMRQAVQGPKYTGPHLAPTTEQLRSAEQAYQVALNLQDETHSKAAVSSTQDTDSSQLLRSADLRVEAAQEALLRLQSKQDDYELLAPRAEATQRAFRKAEKDRLKLEASLSRALENCKLECNYLPVNVDEDAEVADSRRSEGRIPVALWSTSDIDAGEMDVDELIEAGLTQKCVTCLRPARKPKSGLPTCDACAGKRLGITAACEICSSPVRPALNAKEQNLCERCNFSCFRCGNPASIACDSSKVSCYTCELCWTAGALGYELVS